MASRIHIDFETRSAVDITRVGSWKYAQHPSTEVLCLAYSLPDKDEPEIWHPEFGSCEDLFSSGIPAKPEPKDLFQAIKDGAMVFAFNAGFEQAVWQEIMHKRHGWPQIPFNSWRCSSAQASACGIIGSLEKAASVVGLSMKKDKEGQGLTKSMAVPVNLKKNDERTLVLRGDHHFLEGAENLNRLFEYCKQGVRTERAIREALPPMTSREMRIWRLDQIMNSQGLCIDMDLLEEVNLLRNSWQEEGKRKFEEIVGGPSPQALRTWLGEK